jgi:hypothetical protein
LNSDKSTDELAAEIFQENFGFTRIRMSLKERVMKIIEAVITNQKKFDYSYYL